MVLSKITIEKGAVFLLVLPPRKDPYLKQLEVLLPRLSPKCPDYQMLDQQLRKELSGYLGEKSLLYYLDIADHNDALILFGGRFSLDGHYFQIDCLYLTTRFAVIIEVKNHRGEISFNEAGQMLQTWKGQTKPFQNPINQVDEQRIKFRKLLLRLRADDFPVHTIVAFTNQNVILNLSGACQTRMVSEKVPNRLRQIHQQHEKVICSQQKLMQLAIKLKQLHTPRKISILEKYNIEQAMVRRGVQCLNCHEFGMVRQNHNWYCRRCRRFDRDAHIQALIDYALINEPFITNKKARLLLNISSRHVTNRLLKNENIRQMGTTNQTKYDLSKLIHFN